MAHHSFKALFDEDRTAHAGRVVADTHTHTHLLMTYTHQITDLNHIVCRVHERPQDASNMTHNECHKTRPEARVLGRPTSKLCWMTFKGFMQCRRGGGGGELMSETLDCLGARGGLEASALPPDPLALLMPCIT